MSHQRLCEFPECGREHHARGYCGSHLYQIRQGRQLAPIKVRRTMEEKLEFFSRQEGQCTIWTGYRDRHGYGLVSREKGSRLAHRAAWELARGPIVEGLVINHLCGNPPCINLEHLEVVTQRRNVQYRTSINANNTSGYRGVSFDPERGAWQASVKSGGVRYFAGRHDSAERAARAASELRRELGFPVDSTNQPTQKGA